MTNNLRLPLVARAGASPLAEVPAAPTSSAASVSASMHDDVDARGDAPLMQIGDLAREAGKTVRAIHLYEELNLLKPAARSKGRYRLYAREALARVRWIGKLQEMGFSLGDIQTIVKDWEHLNSAPKAMVKMRDVYKKKLEETRENLRRLASLEHEIEASLHYLDTCEVCDPERLLTACKQCDRHECTEAAPELVSGFRAH